MAGTRNFSQMSRTEAGNEFRCGFPRKQGAIGTSYEKSSTKNPSQIGSWPAREGKPLRIKLESESTIRFGANGTLGYVDSDVFIGLIGFGEELVTGDRVFSAAIATAMGEGESCASTTTGRAALSKIDENQTTCRGNATRVVERDRCTHRVSDEIDILTTDPGENRFEVHVERADEAVVRVFGIAVAPKIECVDRSARGESARDLIPPMRVGATAMKQDDGCPGGGIRIRFPFPLQTMKGDVFLGLEVSRLWFQGDLNIFMHRRES